MTGESVPVEKDADVTLSETATLGDRRNMIYMGTVAASGKALAAVVSTGMRTELGHIAGMLHSHEAEPTPLQRRLAELGRILIVVCLAIVAAIFVMQVLRKGDLVEAFMLSVSLAVAAVPEGLPAVVTVALALGLQRMVKRNALVRKLPSVETLGSVTVICSDKTGTLTRNEMTVQELLVGGSLYRVSGTGYIPRGEFHRDQEEVSIATGDDPDLRLALTIGTWCNSARLVPRGDGEDGWQVIGDPTEGALIVVARKAGIDQSQGGKRILYEIPFDSTRKAMSVAVQDSHGKTLFVKGAPRSSSARACRSSTTATHERFPTSDGRRSCRSTAKWPAVHYGCSLAYRPDPPNHHTEDPESNLVFAGLVGMIDPPREEAGSPSRSV